jgi:hypothetical protein
VTPVPAQAPQAPLSAQRLALDEEEESFVEIDPDDAQKLLNGLT